MKKIFLIVILLELCLCKTEAQFFNASANDIAKLKGRKLVVVMQEADPKVLKRIRKHTDKVKRYNAIISELNRTLTRCVQKYWDINEIDFKGYNECRKNNKDTSSFTLSFSSLPNDIEKLIEKDYSRKELLAIAKPGTVEIKLMEHFNQSPVYVWNTPTAYPFEGDLIIAIQQIRNFFSYKYEDPRFNLKKYYNLTKAISFNISFKTLLMDSTQIKKYDNSLKYVNEEYPFPHKLCNFDEIVTAIKTKDTTFSYVTIIPYHDEIGRGGDFNGTLGGGMSKFSEEFFYMHLVIDAATSTVLSIGSTSGFANLNSFENLIDKLSLKNYIKYVE